MLVAEYSTGKNARNEIVVWDRVVMHDDKDAHRVSIKNVKLKYDFFDDGKNLRGRCLASSMESAAGCLPFACGVVLSGGDGCLFCAKEQNSGG